MSLLYGDDFADKTELTANNTFRGIFGGLMVVNAENLVLPATTLANYCYSSMFYGCASLMTAPTLTAPTLVSQCYSEMFQNCTSLNYIKCLATDILNDSTINWVNNVGTNGTFVKKANTTWTTGTNGIPSGWTVVTE